MIQFNSINDLSEAFCMGQISYIPESINISDTEFITRTLSDDTQLVSDVNEDKMMIVMYESPTEQLALVWKLNKSLTLQPSGAYIFEKQAVKPETKKEEEPVMGAHIDIKLLSFNGEQPIKAKVDTGATVCSIHGGKIAIRNDPYYPENQVVDFVFNEKKYTMGLVQTQSVQTADGGVENRPVVQFSVRYKDRTIENVLFNINDRSGMDSLVLVGLNLLKELDIKIDPTMEAVDSQPIVLNHSCIRQQLREMNTNNEYTDSRVHQLYQTLLEYDDVTWVDVLQHVKLHTISVMENLQ